MQPVEPHLLISIAADAMDSAEQLLDAAATLAPYAASARALAVALDAALTD